MNIIDITKDNISIYTKELFNKIKMDYKYDLVVFIAKGGFYIGRDLSEYANVPMVEVFASRSGNKLKKIIKIFLKFIPKKVLLWLRKKELNSNVHSVNIERNVNFNKDVWSKYKKHKKILLVDDSVDTGYSIKKVINEISMYFKDSVIKVASFNVFKKSNDIVKVDYSLFEDEIIRGPWSSDSRENKEFNKEYLKWHESQVR